MLERMGAIGAMAAWLQGAEVDPELLISVVMPTRNRFAVLPGAIASVEAQSYARWELVVVNDGSCDGTEQYLNTLTDPWIRALSCGHRGAAAARNLALDDARGDVITYLDDDNRYDPDWLKAVAFTFATRPAVRVCYGARVIDDLGRAHGGVSTGSPAVHYLPWDRTRIREHNRADMNVLAHRPGPERFDEQLKMLADWDLLLQLTDEHDPVEVPAIAAYYSTADPNRLSNAVAPAELDAEYARVRDRLAGDGRPLQGASVPPARPGA
jgi:glycosyltransferase involved in cell wall biosynthesis